jgi:NCS1 family nucleobase:cation symporter-1
LAIWLHQLFVNITQNNIGAGIDLAGIFPRYISTQRGAVLLTICGIIIQPWRFFTQASVFISVISSFGDLSNCPFNASFV